MASPYWPLPMMGAFTFNGTHSSSFDLICRSVTRPLIPPVKFRRVEIAGLSGAYDLPSNKYGLVNISVKIQFVGDGVPKDALNNYYAGGPLISAFQDIRAKGRAIAAWLSKPNWCSLSFDDDPSVYFQAKVDGQIDLELMDQFPLASADINFICQPYAFSFVGSDTNASSASSSSISPQSMRTLSTDVIEPIILTIINEGSQPIGSDLFSFYNFEDPSIGPSFNITINGSWTELELSMNNKTLKCGEYSGILTLNNIICKAIFEDGSTADDLIDKTSSYLELYPGENILTVNGLKTGTVNVSHTPMWI